MKVEIGTEARYMGQRVKVMAVRAGYPQVKVDIIYLSGARIGRELTVDECDLEALDATARPTFKRL